MREILLVIFPIILGLTCVFLFFIIIYFIKDFFNLGLFKEREKNLKWEKRLNITVLQIKQKELWFVDEDIYDYKDLIVYRNGLRLIEGLDEDFFVYKDSIIFTKTLNTKSRIVLEFQRKEK